MARSTKARNIAIGGGLLGTLVAGLIAFWPKDSEAKPSPTPDDKDDKTIEPPYPMPRPYTASATVCFRSGEPYNIAIMETPEQTSDLLYWLGFPVGVAELLASDAKAQTPVWSVSEGHTPKTSLGLKGFQATARSLSLPGHTGASVAAVDGVFGECTAVSLGEAAILQEAGSWPYKPIPRGANNG